VRNIYFIKSSKTVSSVSVPADDTSLHLLYRNASDSHCKHAASHLHVEVRT